MLGINNIRIISPAYNMQGNQTQPDKAVLKNLDKDTVSFSGLLGPKPTVPKYVKQPAYDAVSKYIQDNPHTYAGKFLKQIKIICEKGTDEIAELDAQIFARKVEKERFGEVSEILMQVKDSTEQPLIKKWMDRFKNTLGKPID